MPILRFYYHEVMDRDHTLILVELIDVGVVTHIFTNLPEAWEDAPQKAIYGNQQEDFIFPTAEAALGMIRSNPAYRPMTNNLALFFNSSLALDKHRWRWLMLTTLDDESRDYESSRALV
jgi:hypothetical protein